MRGAYLRKGEKALADRAELTTADLAALDRALDRFIVRGGGRKIKRPSPTPFIRKTQTYVKTSLFVVMARDAVARGIERGIIHPPEPPSTEGWAEQLEEANNNQQNNEKQ